MVSKNLQLSRTKYQDDEGSHSQAIKRWQMALIGFGVDKFENDTFIYNSNGTEAQQKSLQVSIRFQH